MEAFMANRKKHLREEGYKVVNFLSINCQFIFLDEIAIGGYGIVFKMYNEQMSKIRAVKICSDPGYFEILDWPDLQHKNVVPVLEMFVMDGATIVFIMPMFRDDLMNICKGTEFYKDRYSFDLCRIWFQDVLRGISYIHSKDLCHLDLKLNNAFLKDDGHACVGDFSVMCNLHQVRWKNPFKVYYQPPEFTEFFYAVTGIERTTEFARGDTADMWELGIFLLNILMDQKLVVMKRSPHPNWRLDIFPFLLKVLESKKYLRHCLKKNFTSAIFDDNDVLLCHDILTRLLQLVPENRMCAYDAVTHAFVNIYWPSTKRKVVSPVLLDATYRLPRSEEASDERKAKGTFK